MEGSVLDIAAAALCNKMRRTLVLSSVLQLASYKGKMHTRVRARTHLCVKRNKTEQIVIE